MGKKLALNVFYNLAIFFCMLTAYWGFEHARYEFLLAALFAGAILVVLKIKLIKQVKETQKPK
ncbi:DUF6358 family protein [Mucilaginibacter segetis]|uniref:Uncharacterized protein n=1 Tax=Mucilaginibacter segetis TaxID=2793071 RepID=A0A934PSA9_9SPHI|nr:DUF6358 family protein [Mucilaginibacter segetis]MBK0379878.1 hypothetical protein [Mucilaginibacter segetis]